MDDVGARDNLSMSATGHHTRLVFLVPLRVPRGSLPGMVTGVSRGVVDSLSGRRYIVKRTRPAYYVTGDGASGGYNRSKRARPSEPGADAIRQ